MGPISNRATATHGGAWGGAKHPPRTRKEAAGTGLLLLTAYQYSATMLAPRERT